MRPKSIATVVVVFTLTALVSSIPTLAEVIAASVVSGTISLTAPTRVVFPTPNPPATTILTGIGALGAADTGLDRAKSIEHLLE